MAKLIAGLINLTFVDDSVSKEFEEGEVVIFVSICPAGSGRRNTGRKVDRFVR